MNKYCRWSKNTFVSYNFVLLFQQSSTDNHTDCVSRVLIYTFYLLPKREGVPGHGRVQVVPLDVNGPRLLPSLRHHNLVPGMFFLTSFIKPALCSGLIVSRRAERPDKHHQHPSM